MTLIQDLLDRRRSARQLDKLATGEALCRQLVRNTLAIVLGAGLYGAALGAWRGGTMVAYAAVKLPLVLLATAVVTLVFAWMAALLFGVRTSILQTAALVSRALAVAALALASLVPVVLLLTFAAPDPGEQARTAHNLLYLLHTVVVGGAGVLGTTSLWRGLARFTDRRTRRWLYLCWLTVYAVVGGQVAWALRPFVGSIYQPVTFLRADALDGNVYELIWTDIAPHLLSNEPVKKEPTCQDVPCPPTTQPSPPIPTTPRAASTTGREPKP